ncbi:MAG: prepilin peptidase [Lachnospiraceae bacterium]|nr:prepilin peptidase [Lachnospiraceae bacterium]
MAGNIITGAFLTLCSYSDIKRREIYVKPALALILLGIVFAALQGRDSLLSAFLGALTGVALIIISKLTKGAVGAGDGLVLIVTAFYQGFAGNLSILLMALFLSAVVSATALMIRKCKRDYELPFVPFMLAAFLIQIWRC